MVRKIAWLHSLREHTFFAKTAILPAGLRNALNYLSHQFLKTAGSLSVFPISSLVRYPHGCLRTNLFKSISLRRLSGPQF